MLQRLIENFLLLSSGKCRKLSKISLVNQMFDAGMMKQGFIIYIVAGIILVPSVTVWATRRNPPAFNPFEELAMHFIYGLPLLVLLWPLWVGLSVAEILGCKIVEKPTTPQPAESNRREDPKANVPPLGTQGVCDTPLKPSGRVRIGEEYVSAVTEGGFLPASTAVVVVGHSMNNIVVKEKGEQSHAEPTSEPARCTDPEEADA